MTKCNCSGTNGWKPVKSYDNICDNCHGEIKNEELIRRIMSRIEDLETENLKLSTGLTRAGMEPCIKCGEFYPKKDMLWITQNEHGYCFDCFSHEPTWEESGESRMLDILDEKYGTEITFEILKFARNNGLDKKKKPFWADRFLNDKGVFVEPFLSVYRSKSL